MPTLPRPLSISKRNSENAPYGWQLPCSPLGAIPVDARRELIQHLSRRAHRHLAIAVLCGDRSISESDLIQLLRLQRKRPSIARQVVALVMDSLRAKGVLPRNFVVAN
jgi:hypothetical protein